MKKIFSILAIALAVLAVSCQKDPVENTACVDMAGQWYVTMDGYYADGSEMLEDPFGLGQFLILTSNSAANIATEMILADEEDDSFWNFRCKIKADPATMTFSATDSENFSYEDCTVTVTGGKIVKGGAKTPSGQPADYIEFHILFSDDTYAPKGYWDDMFIHGYRYTGLAADE